MDYYIVIIAYVNRYDYVSAAIFVFFQFSDRIATLLDFLISRIFIYYRTNYSLRKVE